MTIQCEPMHPDAEGWSEWIHPLSGYLMQCCDCGLIHEMQFEIAEPNDPAQLNPGEGDHGVIIFRARRYEPDSDGSPKGGDATGGSIHDSAGLKGIGQKPPAHTAEGV